MYVCAADVAQPRVLRDWSTVGSTSVSIVWRCNSNVRNVDAFLLYFRPLHNAEMKRRPPQSLDHARLSTLTDADFRMDGFSRIRVHRFVPKRSQAVLRHLQSATAYVLILFAVNELARSPPSTFFFQTAPANDSCSKQTLSRRRPVGRSLCHCLMAFTARITRAMFSLFLFIYIMFSILLIVVHREAVYNDLCYLLIWTELLEFCPGSCLEPSEEAPHKPHNTPHESYVTWLYNESYVTWLYNVFSS